MLVVLRLPNNIVIVSKTYPFFLNVKEGFIFLTKPLFHQGRVDGNRPPVLRTATL